MPDSTSIKHNPLLPLVGLILFLGAVAVTAYVVAQRNSVGDIRNQAAAPTDKASCTGCSPDGFEWRWHSNTQKCSKSAIKCGSDNGGTNTTQIVSCNPKPTGAVQCGKTPDGCGGFCILPRDKTCDDMLRQECNFEPVRGANFRSGYSSKSQCPGGFQSAWCSCGGAGVCFDRGFDGSNNTSNQCDTSDGLCAVYNNSNPGTTGGPACGKQTIYFCDKNVDLSGQKSCDTSTGGKVLTSIPSCFCGTIQVDTTCQGFKTYTGTCGCSNPTNPPVAGACIDIKIFKNNTQVTPSQVRPGETVHLAVKGSGTPSKARFRINGGSWQETTQTNSNGFYILSYTFPQNVVDFVIEGEVFVNGAWK